MTAASTKAGITARNCVVSVASAVCIVCMPLQIQPQHAFAADALVVQATAPLQQEAATPRCRLQAQDR
jgi:hypothetical protein